MEKVDEVAKQLHRKLAGVEGRKGVDLLQVSLLINKQTGGKKKKKREGK